MPQDITPFYLSGDDAEFEEDQDLEDDSEAAEAGEVCANCGGEFVESQGEAALCETCWDNADADDRKTNRQSTSPLKDA